MSGVIFGYLYNYTKSEFSTNSPGGEGGAECGGGLHRWVLASALKLTSCQRRETRRGRADGEGHPAEGKISRAYRQQERRRPRRQGTERANGAESSGSTWRGVLSSALIDVGRIQRCWSRLWKEPTLLELTRTTGSVLSRLARSRVRISEGS